MLLERYETYLVVDAESFVCRFIVASSNYKSKDNG